MADDDPFALPDGYGGTRPPEPEMRYTVPAANGGDGTFAPWLDPADIPSPQPAAETRTPWWRRRIWLKRAGLAIVVGFLALLAWLAIFAPVSRTAQPIVPPQLTLASSDGTPFVRAGAITDRAVRIADLPPHVAQAFLAIEDRRFYDHWGIDPLGIGRALWSNIRGDAGLQGGSTITQQLAKITYLENQRTIGRKLQELPIALWLEAWLSKDQILERYLSNAYFGDNTYGLRAASLHYFYRQPERLTLTQAAMLAGLMKAPSRYAPTRNIKGAQSREKTVLAAMVAAGYLTADRARAVPLATVDHRPPPNLARGSYFADWAMREARTERGSAYAGEKVVTTLDRRLQRLADQVARSGAPRGAQVALVAMRKNGEVVAMVGGRDYDASPFNRATQAQRQPGSTFKLIVYLAALRAGLTPDTLVSDTPIDSGSYRPGNAGGRYRGEITLRQAFAHSSNVVAVRLYNRLGHEAIQRAANELGITRTLPTNASVALGSADLTLIELTAAYAAVAAGKAPVEPHALKRPEKGFFGSLFDNRKALGSHTVDQLRDLLRAAVNTGTGNAARLSVPAYGKTGTSQDSRDALFVGYAGDLVVGVWIGHDDNRPLGSASGGGAPARIWRNFMAGALPGAAPRPKPRPEPLPTPEITLPEGILPPEITIDPDNGVGIEGDIGGVGVRIDREGVRVTAPDPRPPVAPPPGGPPGEDGR
jgi:penicillin-binding protein 1A